MTKLETVLFEKCPLCGEGTIQIEKRKLFLFSKSKIHPCPTCSAEFATKGADNYQLLFCEPRKVVGKRGHGRHGCRERVFRGCYLGATLPKVEWEKIAEGGESFAFERFLDMSEKFQQGLLPTYPSEVLPIALEKGEVVHYVSSPVFMDEEQPSRGKPTNKGELVLTNKRVIFLRETGALSFPLKEVERVEESPPGFLIIEKDSFEPRYFFSPPYDPIFAAVLGAIQNLKKRR